MLIGLISIYVATLLVIVLFYWSCGGTELSFKPTKQKLIMTPIFSAVMIAMNMIILP
jgi:hypothetical protein